MKKVVILCSVLFILLPAALIVGCQQPEPTPTPPIPAPAPPAPSPTEALPPTPVSPAEFKVSALSITPTQVVVGEEAIVKADVSNVGEAEGTYTTTLTVNGAEVEEKKVTLAGGKTTTVSFTIVEDIGGAYDIEVSGLTGTLMVLKPAELKVNHLVVTPSLLFPGEEATITATALNTGEVKGTLEPTLTINGVEVDSQRLTVEPGASDEVTFSFIRDVPGDYEIELNGTSTHIEVKEVETYQSEMYYLSITYPKGWELEEYDDAVVIGREGIVRFVVIIDIVDTQRTLKDLYDDAMDFYRELFPDLQIISTNELVEEGEITAFEVTISYKVGGGINVKNNLRFSKRGRYFYTIDSSSLETQYSTYEPILAACTRSFKPPEVAVGSYTDTINGFSLDLPQGWSAEETGIDTFILDIHNPVDDPYIFMYMVQEYLYQDTSPEESASSSVAAFSDLPGFRVVSAGAVNLGTDTEGYEYIFTNTEEGYKVKRRVTSVISGTQSLTLTTYSLDSTYQEKEASIDQIYNSFTLVEPKPFGVSRQTSLFLSWGEIVTLDPALFEGSSAGIVGAIFSGLVRIDKDLKAVPDIAEKWDISDNGKTYTFYLREGVEFHDGKPVTARDFKYSWERACDPETESEKALLFLGDIVGAKEMLAGEATGLSGVMVIDDFKLEVTIDGSKPYFLSKLAYPTAYVVDRASVARGMNWTDKPNGTGPFKLKEWMKDELLILERNANYYLMPAKLEHVVLQIFAGQSMMMYEQGEIDVTDVYIDDLDRVLDPQNSLNKELLTTFSINMGYLGFNVTKPPFDDPKVRRAFALALDMDKILQVSLKGNSERAGGFLPPGIPGHNDELEPLPFDPDLARQLITESKYGSVDNLPPIVLYSLYYLGPVEEAAVAMWWQNLRVEVEAQIIEELEEMLNLRHKRERQLFFSGWGADFIDPQNFLEVLFHSQSEDNDSAYSNPAVDAALKKAAVEQDEEARLRMYQDIEKMVLEDLPVAPFYQSTKSHVLVKPYVEGYYLAPMGIHIWKDISIKPHR